MLHQRGNNDEASQVIKNSKKKGIQFQHLIVFISTF